MGVTRKPVIEGPHIFMQHRVAADGATEVLQLVCGWQFTVDQQVADFHEITIGGERFDRVAAITENSLLAIQESDITGCRSRVHVAFVEGDEASLCSQFGDV